MTARAGSSAFARVAVSVTASPSLTGFGAADRLTATGASAASSMAISTEVSVPGPRPAGRVPNDTVNVSSGSSWSVS